MFLLNDNLSVVWGLETIDLGRSGLFKSSTEFKFEDITYIHKIASIIYAKSVLTMGEHHGDLITLWAFLPCFEEKNNNLLVLTSSKQHINSP